MAADTNPDASDFQEIRAVLTQIAVYCGLPIGVDCFRVARAVLDGGKGRS